MSGPFAFFEGLYYIMVVHDKHKFIVTDVPIYDIAQFHTWLFREPTFIDRFSAIPSGKFSKQNYLKSVHLQFSKQLSNLLPM